MFKIHRFRRGAPSRHPTPITDAETHAALSYLKRYPSGLTRADLERLFGSDRRGRDVIAAIAELGIAPVIVTTSPYQGDAQVYRLATSIAEVEAEQLRLLAYETSARRRREGVARAWERGPEAPQGALF
jgi:hypothetical protein